VNLFLEAKILKTNGERINFVVKGTFPSVANALRRAMTSEVPVMAIEDVVIVENSSIIYDEIVAHRLGLIPLTTDLKSYTLPEECDCGSEMGCSKCRAGFTLEVEAEDDVKTVYSGDLTLQDPNIKPVSREIPLVRLGPKQKIKLEAYARLGRGIEHAKWQATSACTYKYYPRVALDEKKCNGCGECVTFCPKGVYEKKGTKVEVVDELKCTLCMDCIDHCPIKPSPITVDWDGNSFIFNIESTGALPPNEIVTAAVKVLLGKLDQLTNILGEK